MKKVQVILIITGIVLSLSAQKEIFIPKSIRSMDLNSTSSQWCHARTAESENIVVFWERGFGDNPANAPGDYRVVIDELLSTAEKAYTFYRDTLGFVEVGSSFTDDYKLIIFLLYSTEWTANGSGEDDTVASLRVSALAAGVNNVVAHEIGHCFQYMTSCDGEGGFRYGLGENGKGGNGFWEQCAQWMSFKVYPEKQFSENDFKVYIQSSHLHILHETPRYANYFIQDYWTFKHEKTFVGKLWRESRFPEDPVEAYMRINELSQEEFNDEIFEHAACLTTWDLPEIRDAGKKYIDSRTQVAMHLTGDDFRRVDQSVCIENYGYHSIKLNPPKYVRKVSVRFRGQAGANGYRMLNTDKGGWRFGFVALCDDDSRVYSDVGVAHMQGATNPDTTLTFICPETCEKLWLVVSGAPQEHWKHEWDDNDDNDEQWPYEVAFTNTNLLGEHTATEYVASEKDGTMMPSSAHGKVVLPEKRAWKVFSLTGAVLQKGYGDRIDLQTSSHGAYIIRYGGRLLRVTAMGRCTDLK